MSEQITAQMVNQLRSRTGAGIMDCKRALLNTNGKFEEAIDLLKKEGVAMAAKKAGREAREGVIESYIHLGGKVGVLLELNCETDFVAKNDEFKQLAKDICMHIAAASPLYTTREDVPDEMVDKERSIAEAQAEGKPKAAIDRIVMGKLDKWYSQFCLLEQSFVKNQDQSINDLLTEKIAKMGENIIVNRFHRYQLGD
ncbi:MAG: translation elongation factor Ts [Verrucomicrobia bacterium CG_4_10_14_3_um_filter_43_23]|nr:MAG: translation elongation factor Ts [Verrucomicrobia bacterium CG1_02_43_26]PIP59557.1 MAG: translation elongation factor Ts [Verrucomicrobia bacterium CG22_combo_CG10-13_8_21_14_all_43_17]PIX58857.1 MAG: translation elongation factor Ts [Verrucomicrobia bacterium CG_4_10_14_3_um_filter_43_23]PIY60952.1 MAG: translation elongation factor Ts [Verrucomicrobia bacterium CG_4_10_14_0_8_um_filter_43_34]PJA44867.1 MAG: translation elongation factor Ts [Verrucomicrobia bacterium CG_4_9_14_3_um_fi